VLGTMREALAAATRTMVLQTAGDLRGASRATVGRPCVVAGIFPRGLG
jgi:hypothetical protein